METQPSNIANWVLYGVAFLLPIVALVIYVIRTRRPGKEAGEEEEAAAAGQDLGPSEAERVARPTFRQFIEQYDFILAYLALGALTSAAVLRLVFKYALDDPWVLGTLIGGGVAAVLYVVLLVVLHPQQVRAALTGRTARYGSNAVVMSIAFIGILVALNYLAGRYHRRFDVTELQEHTLSDQSIQVLAEIDRPVEIVGFFRDNDPQRASFGAFIERYLDHSEHLSYTEIDPDREPAKARQYVDQYGSIPYPGLLLESGERRETVYSASEQDITSALLKVTSEGKKVIYFLTGHQEYDPESYGDESYSGMAGMLRNQNYEVRKLNLAVTETVPSDTSVLVVAGPQKELLEDERTRLQAYLAGGGKALIMQDPLLEVGLNEILSQWNVRFGEGVVIDPASSLPGNAAFPGTDGYPYSQVTKDMNGLTSFFPVSRPVEEIEETLVGDITFTPLVETTIRSWAEVDTETIALDEGIDTVGPLVLAAMVEAPVTSEETAAEPDLKTRMVLVGDSEFASDAFAGAGNAMLFLNAINWLAEEESLIAIGPKGGMPRTVFLTGVQTSLIVFLGVILIPGALIGIAIVVWWLRR